MQIKINAREFMEGLGWEPNLFSFVILLAITIFIAMPLALIVAPFFYWDEIMDHFPNVKGIFSPRYPWWFRKKYFLWPLVTKCIYTFAISLIARFFVFLIFVIACQFDFAVLSRITELLLTWHSILVFMSIYFGSKLTEKHYDSDAFYEPDLWYFEHLYREGML